MQTRVILIRHGRTAWNRSHRYCGWSDIDLDRQGVRQIKRAASRLKGVVIDKVYSSPLLRAVHSARLVFGRRRITLVPGLAEANFGALEGITDKQASEMRPKIPSHWLISGRSSYIPGAEPAGKFIRRVEKALKKIIAANPGKTVAVLTHAGPIMVILSRISGRPAWKIRVENAGIVVIDFDKKKGGKISSLESSFR